MHAFHAEIANGVSHSISSGKISFAPSARQQRRDSSYVLCANICTVHRQRRRGRFTVPPPDAPTSSNNFSEHKSSVRPGASRPGYPRIIAKRYCLASIDLAYKILGYPHRLCMVRSEGGSMPVAVGSRISLKCFVAPSLANLVAVYKLRVFCSPHFSWSFCFIKRCQKSNGRLRFQ